MRAAAFPIWLLLLVAMVIALSALGLAQLWPGSGMVFVAAATMLWTAFVVSRSGKAVR